LGIGKDASVVEFNEKPQAAEGRINGGFFVASRSIFDCLENDADHVMFEQEPMKTIAREGQLMAFPHDGFWQPMDTFFEYTQLNRLWAEGKAPWKTWKS
jgi:glucose-1-phosphate cytidylyltransferase